MRPPDKNRYLRALDHVAMAEIPFQEDEFDVEFAEKLLGRPLPKVRSYELPVADMVELNLRAGNDLVFYANLWELGRKNVIDETGRKHYVDGTIKTRRQLAGIRPPDLSEVARSIETVLRALEGTGLGLKYRPNQVPFLVMVAIGYEDYYLVLRDDPDFVHEFEKRVHDYCLEELNVALSHPVDVIQVSATFGSTSGPLISRPMIEEFEYPFIQEQARIIRGKGVPVGLHIDGSIAEFMPDIIRMGVSVVHPIDPSGGSQDIYEVKRRFGDAVALHGNIDVGGVLAFGTPEAVARDVEEHCARLAVGGGYVCGSSHNITEIVPLENFCAMRDAAHRFRCGQ